MIRLKNIGKIYTTTPSKSSFYVHRTNETNHYHCLKSKSIAFIAQSALSHQYSQSFSMMKSVTPQKGNENGAEKTSIYFIQYASDELMKLDSQVLDQCCLIFSSKYLLRQNLQIQASNNNDNEVIQSLQTYIHNKKETTLTSLKIYENLRLIFQFLNNSKIGFLRGDLHANTFYELNKDITQKIQKKNEINQRRTQMQYQTADFKKILHLITEEKHYRLPLQGIRNGQLQSKINLFHRQIMLEHSAYQISHNKYQNILESLMKINRVQQAEVVRKFIIQWIVPLTGALKEEQNRCMQKDSSKKRSYNDILMKIKVQKISYIALTQLIIDLFQHYYKAQTMKNMQHLDSNFILQNKYGKRLIKKIETQIVYEREEQQFKDNQRQYDLIIKNQKLHDQKKDQSQSKPDQQQPKKQEEDDDENMDFDSSSFKTSSADASEKKPNYWKSQMFKERQKVLKYRYVPQQNRKQFVNNLQERVNKMYLSNEIPDNVAEDLSNLIIYLIKQLLTITNKYGYKVPLLTSETYTVRKDNAYVNVSVLRFNQHFLGQLLPKLQKDQNPFLHLDYSVPTIIEPLPWIQPQIGGYYSQGTTVMRYSNCPVQQRLVQYADNHRIFKILDFLSSIQWKINQQVLDLVQIIWTEGSQQNCVPKRYSQLLNPFLSKLKEQTDYEKRKELYKKIQALRDQHSQRSNFLLKLTLARSFKHIDKFYFPHNLDFRGRTYPIPPHINHIGDDLSRGLLSFGKGQKLGLSGLKWLKIHTANLMGKDKATIPQKLKFIEQNVQKIKNMGEHPLQHRQWLSYEDCWQGIASILDLTKAWKCQKPQEYISFMHVHQDGSCNGLQHYAALGRDVQGAYQVNLGPSQTPGDIYTYVSKMVSQMIQQDILIQQDPKQLQMILKLRGNIKRKTIKQTVMTSVYGVTYIGARQQIYKQLRDQGFLQEQEVYNASRYLSKLTLKAISNLFVNAHEIKKWFKECAKKVTETGNPIGWISPLGLPIVQPYRKQLKQNIVRTVGHKIQIPREIQNIPINRSKQVSAFPPNFVHSLDSTHMMYTAQECKNKGIMFAAVHDSFWTHPSTVQEMNSILREQFIRLHSENVLQSLKKTLQERFPQQKFPQIPPRGNFDLQLIKQSLYFFS